MKFDAPLLSAFYILQKNNGRNVCKKCNVNRNLQFALLGSLLKSRQGPFLSRIDVFTEEST